MPQTKNIIIKFSSKAQKQLPKLPLAIINKLEKQVDFLIQDRQHPSLHTKKFQGSVDFWEARINYHYRFTFEIEEEVITILSVGPHDEGLGKN